LQHSFPGRSNGNPHNKQDSIRVEEATKANQKAPQPTLNKTPTMKNPTTKSPRRKNPTKNPGRTC
jgi:hypothetical protein